MASCAGIRDGEVFDAVGYRLKSKEPFKTALAFDLPKALGAAYTGFPLSASLSAGRGM